MLAAGRSDQAVSAHREALSLARQIGATGEQARADDGLRRAAARQPNT
jgi:hypothetical protein